MKCMGNISTECGRNLRSSSAPTRCMLLGKHLNFLTSVSFPIKWRSRAYLVQLWIGSLPTPACHTGEPGSEFWLYFWFQLPVHVLPGRQQVLAQFQRLLPCICDTLDGVPGSQLWPIPVLAVASRQEVSVSLSILKIKLSNEIFKILLLRDFMDNSF